VSINWYGKEIEGKIELATLSGITAAALQLEGRAALLCPVKTGRLRGSITYRTYKSASSPQAPAKSGDGVHSKPAKFEAYVGTSVEYASHVEYGTKRSASQSFLRKAADENKEKLSGIFTAQFRKMLK
jgi:HK97 gp10 family phage protein